MVRLLLIVLFGLFVSLIMRALFRPLPALTGPGRSAPPPPGPMSRAEALEVLGLEEGASKAEVTARYRSLMKRVHPDHPAGLTYLASKVNQAKEVLGG